MNFPSLRSGNLPQDLASYRVVLPVACQDEARTCRIQKATNLIALNT
jgi:hypothetical protein